MTSTLQFLLNILDNMRIPSAIMEPPYDTAHLSDFGAHQLAVPAIDYTKYASRFFTTCIPKTIYRAVDDLSFSYIILMLPDELYKSQDCPENDASFLVIGPYTLTPFREADILLTAEKYHINAEDYPAFRSCYEQVPIIKDYSVLLTLINSFAASIWGSMEAFTMTELTPFESLTENGAAGPLHTFLSPANTEELLYSMKSPETRYAAENELLQMVSQGQIHKIDMYLNLIDFEGTEQRHVDKLRNVKNYAIILNTLLRKTAEQNAVHPIHIDKLSSAIAKKIELQTSELQVTQLLKEMVRKYTFLIKNHTLRGYSPLIKQVITQIDNNLSGDLSLGTLAESAGYNASYLSAVFKKETGQTLTEYVTRKRIEHAVFLLNATNMQIQTIAAYCGVPDVCYFTKLFKKVMGKTPTEYRNEILG